MQHELLYEYLKSSKTLIKVQDFLKDFCFLELELLDLTGKPLLTSSSLSQKSTDFQPAGSSFSEILLIAQPILNNAKGSSEPQIFRNPDNLIKILVPIVYEGIPVAFLYTGELGSFRFQKNQLNSILNYLKTTVKSLIDEDFKLLRGFEGTHLTHRTKIMQRVIQFISENYNDPDLTLNEVSKSNNISYYYLSHLFNRELNTSFSAFLTNLRMEVASRLLKDKSLTINQISFSCGFVDAGYFSKVFKKFHGITPAEYRSGAVSQSKALSRARTAAKLKKNPSAGKVLQDFSLATDS